MFAERMLDGQRKNRMRRIAWGVVGWLAAVLPLLAVNVAGYADVFDAEAAVAMGAAALLGGIGLGALVTGLLTGRPSADRAGGATATLPAGSTAAALYIASLIAVVEVAIRTQAAPTIVAEHPLRITGAIICLGAILLGGALIVGTLAGRLHSGGTPEPISHSAPSPSTAQPAQSRPRYAANPGQPTRGGYPDRGDFPGSLGSRSGQRRRAENGYNDYRDAHDAHDTYDQRQSAPRRGDARSGSRGSQGAGRDDDWCDTRR
jgi:hypothetical protein